MGMGFLLLNIFLGLLGTFWFRTQQRRSEIALHKAHGATDRAIFSRLLSEGILLLAIVTPVALLIDYNLAHLELNSWRNGTTLEWDRLLLCAAISFVLITLMIVIGIGIPARKAMKVRMPMPCKHDRRLGKVMKWEPILMDQILRSFPPLNPRHFSKVAPFLFPRFSLFPGFQSGVPGRR